MPYVPAEAFRSYGLRLLVPVSNFMMVVSGIMLLVKAQELQALPPGSLVQGDGSADKLESCAILGICIGIMETSLVLSYLWVAKNFSVENPKFVLGTKVTAMIQGILIALALIYMIVPGVGGGPEAYKEIRAVGFASSVFIFFYSYIVIGLVKSVWLKEPSLPIVSTKPGTPAGRQYGSSLNPMG